jgi:MFS superfamily sulfate permease-like transporter
VKFLWSFMVTVGWVVVFVLLLGVIIGFLLACVFPWVRNRVNSAQSKPSAPEPNVTPVSPEKQREIAVRLFAALPLGDRSEALRLVAARWNAETAALLGKVSGGVH